MKESVCLSTDTVDDGQIEIFYLDDDWLERRRLYRMITFSELGSCTKVTSFHSVSDLENRMSQGTTPDVLVLDIYFGEEASVNGLELLSKYSRLFPDLPILIRSSATEKKVQAKELGAIGFLDKSEYTKTQHEFLGGLITAIKKKKGLGINQDLS